MTGKILADRELEIRDASGFVLARLDIDRETRSGAPEAVFAQGKTAAETLAVAEALVAKQGYALVTRAEPETLLALRVRWPDLRTAAHAGTALAGSPPAVLPGGPWVGIAVAGTSDLPVAEEAAVTLESLGLESRVVSDVGVAGLHRLLRQLDALRQAAVILAVAGMEGALPSVLAGLTPAPVVAVPTSVGYGASLGGLSALLGMLNSCSPGITVVNIDNGFGAAVAASRMIRHSCGTGKARQA
ncbi:MAG: nickel pincer cofactor biosynthesis protein LarB [Planctomycetota bacterium]|nr:nickel pincer cofactor biosynthesis protein LarB [Planctomycetota bacterium]